MRNVLVAVYMSTTNASGDEAEEQSLWDDLYMYDRAHDVEALSRVLAHLCLYMAGREAHLDRMGNTAKTASMRKQPERFSLQHVEKRLRASSCTLRLIACRRIEGMPDEIRFVYPRRNDPCDYFVSLCVEGDEPAVHEMIAQGCADETENLRRLAHTGFLLRRPTAAAMAETSVMDTLTAMPAHVQLDTDCALIRSDVPAAWRPEHCTTCRRVASSPVHLYALQCCGGEVPLYSCSKDCWRRHVALVHCATPAAASTSEYSEDDDDDDGDDE